MEHDQNIEHEQLVERAIKAINEVFEDLSVSPEVAGASLERLMVVIRRCIADLEC